MGVEPQSRCIFTRELNKIFTAGKALFWYTRQIARGIFDANDMFVSGQLSHGFHTHTHRGAAGDIVDDDIHAAVRRG